VASEAAIPVVYGGAHGLDDHVRPLAFRTGALVEQEEIRAGDILQLEKMALNASRDLEAAGRSSAQREREIVFEALENPDFEWRTISGISEETGLATETVSGVLAKHGDQIVRSSKVTKDGRTLYTTRARFRDIASPWSVIRGALRNRAD